MKTYSLALAVCGMALPVAACDLCSVYNIDAAEGTRNHGFSVSLAEQFTHFGTVQVNGREVRDPSHQYLDSVVAQAVLGYTFNDWATVQLNIPVIAREFKRPVGFFTDHGHESGLGDISILGHFTPYRYEKMNTTFSWSVFAGVKFPTGDSDRIKEEFNEIEVEGAPESGIHGHDLALGSGSYDGLIGTGIYVRHRRGFFNASVQYSIRTEGDFKYRYANDLMWSGGPGVFLVLEEEWTASLQFVVSGEDKGMDRFQGEKAADTGITSVFVGPQANFTWSDKLSAQVGVDIPVLLNNTALQAVPDYRVRGAVTWRF
jgi:hypothetical protein